MKPILLDTNVVSELRKNKARINPQVLNWAKSLELQDSYLSVITVYELERGILLLAKKDPQQSSDLSTWLNTIKDDEFKGRLLPISTEIASRAAALQADNPRPVPDSFIAATALEHNLMLATRNTQDFLGTDVTLINPWEAP